MTAVEAEYLPLIEQRIERAHAALAQRRGSVGAALGQRWSSVGAASAERAAAEVKAAELTTSTLFDLDEVAG